ncbi:unnamed protein product [Cylindrotheca closterium]|uniref:STI1 domain-containing protein n=1 Tax=Cylindrotheca closterium TaxID=2856 RepID=A0AAD2CCJ3_9STRA|nr:unnamed protein product [Cylindrotheca closterium]
MISIKQLFKIFTLLACFVAIAVAKKEEEDPTGQAIKDLKLGMAGIKEAANNPELLAQLMQDLQNPELMAEAKKMMESPEYQKQMKQWANSADFKDAAKQATDFMKDPAKAAEMEAKMEHMMKVGADQLKANSGKTMEDAMAAMADPAVLSQMTQMIKDPSFQANLAQMAKDPTFKQYIDSLQDMMKDPSKRAQFEKLGAQIRSEL